jgi:FHS family L-fucose permease-like MFS transporter
LPAYRLEEAISVIPLYLVVAAILIALGLAIAWVRLPIVPFERDLPLPGDSVWRHRSLLLGAIAVFACVGSEVSIGRSLVSYLGQPNIGNFSAEAAAKYVPLYWGSAMLGRLIGFVLLRKLPDRRLLGPSALLAAGLVTTTILSDGQVAMWSILLVGLFNAILFPSIFALSIQGLGALTGKGSGLLCAAIAGGAVIPEIHGVVADHVGVHYAFVLPVLCYLYVMFFGFKGSQRVLDNSAIMAGKELWNETSSSI